MKYILGTKQYMTQVFAENGAVSPGTVIAIPKNVVTAVKTPEKDGYVAVQVSGGETRKLGKAQKGHFKELGNFSFSKEFRVFPEHGKNVGDAIEAAVFAPGDKIAVSAISKGKGFQGVVKRHNFSGGSRTHGQKHSEREPGSIGGGARAGGNVAKNKKMPGRMGGERVTVRNLTVLSVDATRGEIIVKGAVPGRKGTLVEIRGQEKNQET